MVLGLFAVKVVNLQEIALAFQSEAKVSSCYRRLQRFFSNFQNTNVVKNWPFLAMGSTPVFHRLLLPPIPLLVLDTPT